MTSSGWHATLAYPPTWRPAVTRGFMTMKVRPSASSAIRRILCTDRFADSSIPTNGDARFTRPARPYVASIRTDHVAATTRLFSLSASIRTIPTSFRRREPTVAHPARRPSTTVMGSPARRRASRLSSFCRWADAASAACATSAWGTTTTPSESPRTMSPG